MSAHLAIGVAEGANGEQTLILQVTENGWNVACPLSAADARTLGKGLIDAAKDVRLDLVVVGSPNHQKEGS